MGTYKFIKDYVSPNAKDTQAKQKDTKYRPTDQQTLQAIVDILFDGNVDEHSNITINGLREDFSGKCHFTVINDIVVIGYIDIFHSVNKPIHGENTRRAMGKFIEQLKDKYTIKVISRSIDSSKYGIGIEPTLIITGFTEEELTILRGLLIEFLSYSKHVAKVKYGECLSINSLVDHFTKFIRNYTGLRNLAEKAYEIQDMLRDGALSNKAIAYHLNLDILDIINEHSAFTILDNDNRKDNDGFYIVPNVMSSYVRPMLPRKDGDKQVGVVFEKTNSIELPEGEYVLFKDVYFKRTLANMGSHFKNFIPLKLLVKFSEIEKYLANISDENKNVIFPDNKLVYCNSEYGVETPIFNYSTVDEILSYSGYEIVSNTDLDNSRTFKVAEGIYGFGTMVYEFTDSKHDDNPLEPFYEYIPNK